MGGGEGAYDSGFTVEVAKSVATIVLVHRASKVCMDECLHACFQKKKKETEVTFVFKRLSSTTCLCVCCREQHSSPSVCVFFKQYLHQHREVFLYVCVYQCSGVSRFLCRIDSRDRTVTLSHVLLSITRVEQCRLNHSSHTDFIFRSRL